MDKDSQEKEKLINSIVKGIAYAENNGKPDINNPRAGKSGELKSIFQFEPSTWKADAKKVFGNEDAPLTPDNETYVMQYKVAEWIKEGKTVDEMASIHNSGNPNAYKENHKGVNKYGVKFDTPAYTKKVADYARQFYKDNGSNMDSSGTALTTNSSTDTSDPLSKILSTISEAKKNTNQPSIQGNALVPNATPNNAVSRDNLSNKLSGLFKGQANVSGGKAKALKTSRSGLL